MINSKSAYDTPNGRVVFFMSVILILVLLCSCSNNDNIVGKLTISETAGYARDLEYVEIELSINQLPSNGEALFIQNKGSGKLIKGQILRSNKEASGSYLISCLFPISIQAHETAQYTVIVSGDIEISTDLIAEGVELELRVENKYYVANMTSEKATVENGLGSGQLTALTLKNFENQVLKRSLINMHWAPNFQKKEQDYKTIGHIRQFDSLFVSKGPYLITTYRSGKVEGYEEIQVEGKYQFYAGFPYFIFSSQMTMVDNVVLTMLRNDEMTMDSLFTHAMFPLPDGEVKTVSLYDEPPLSSHYSIKELRKTPVDANANWFCFYNDSLKYGFGSVRIRYDYTNSEGNQSPMLNPETRITYASENGRYWDRRFVFEQEDSLTIPIGSRYTETNAYVIFPVNPENPSEKIAGLFEQLTHPVIVKYKRKK